MPPVRPPFASSPSLPVRGHWLPAISCFTPRSGSPVMRRLLQVILEQMAPGARVEYAGLSFHDLVEIRDRRVREEVNLIRRDLELEQCVVSDAVNIAVAARGEMD